MLKPAQELPASLPSAATRGKRTSFLRLARLMTLLAGAAALIAGCADSTASRADAPAYVAPAWEAVFLPAETTAASDAALASGRDLKAWETRNDHRLAARTERSTLASDDWPDTSRPTLERARYIYLQRQPESILYLRRVRDRGRGSHD